MQRLLSLALLMSVCSMPAHAESVSVAAADRIELAQTQSAPAQPTAPATGTPATDAQQAPEEPIGNVATVIGSATVVRNNATAPLKVKDDIYLNDVVQTAANSSLGITFIDATTFNLRANAQITIDSYVYEDGGRNNAGVFDVAKGTVAFVAASVAKTGDMKITTPTATLGIRGTTGLVEVPAGGGAGATNNIKLYPDADGKVGRIEVNDRAGARLGFLTQGASGFTIRPGIGGARVAAVPLVIPPQIMQRDQGFVRQLHSTQNLGRQVVLQQRDFRRANPNFINPNRPIRQPGQQPNGAPGQNRPGQQQQPGAPNRQGQQQPGSPAQPGTTPRTGQPQQPGSPTQPGQAPRTGQPQQPTTPARPGITPRTGQPQQPGAPSQPGLSPRTGQPSQPVTPSQPGLPPRVGPTQQPGALPPTAPPPGVQQPGLRQGMRPLGQPGGPGALRPGLNRPALRLPPPKAGKPPKEKRY